MAMHLLLSGTQLTLNADGAGTQERPVVTALANGGFAAAWISDIGGVQRAMVRQFGADGAAAGPEVALSDTGGTAERAATFFSTAAGEVWLAWVSQSGADTQIVASRYDAETALWGASRVLETGLAAAAQDLAFCAQPEGGFTLAYAVQEGANLTSYARFFGADIEPLTARFVLASRANSINTASSLVPDGQGGILAFWQQEVAQRDVVLRHFAADGSTLAPERIVNEVLIGSQVRPKAVALAGGDVLVLWQHLEGNFQMHARRYSAEGQPLGGVFILGTALPGHNDPRILALPDGGYAISWSEIRGDDGEIFVQIFDAQDQALCPPTMLHAPDLVEQIRPSLTLLADGRLVVAWQDVGVNADLHAQIVDPRLRGAEEVQGTDLHPRLLDQGAGLEVAAGARLVVWNQHGVQGDGTAAAHLSLSVAGRIEVGGDGGAFDGVCFVGTEGGLAGGAGLHRIEVAASGAIVSAAGAAVRLGGDQNALLNAGLLAGAAWAVIGGAGRDHIVNQGQIQGLVTLNGGDDYFDGRGGQVLGVVQGGAGNDTYILSGAAFQIHEVAGEGWDHVQAQMSYRLGAGLEALTLFGGGAYAAFGNAAANHLRGNTAANRIEGGAGGDRLWGDGGADRLYGGSGRDTLAGGSGGDSFVFAHWQDSPRSAPDVITDFRRGSDHVNLAALVGPKFAFEGFDGFSGAGPSVRLRRAHSGLWAEADLNGDGRVDLALFLVGLRGLSASDFFL